MLQKRGRYQGSGDPGSTLIKGGRRTHASCCRTRCPRELKVGLRSGPDAAVQQCPLKALTQRNMPVSCQRCAKFRQRRKGLSFYFLYFVWDVLVLPVSYAHANPARGPLSTVLMANSSCCSTLFHRLFLAKLPFLF